MNDANCFRFRSKNGHWNNTLFASRNNYSICDLFLRFDFIFNLVNYTLRVSGRFPASISFDCNKVSIEDWVFIRKMQHGWIYLFTTHRHTKKKIVCKVAGIKRPTFIHSLTGIFFSFNLYAFVTRSLKSFSYFLSLILCFFFVCCIERGEQIRVCRLSNLEPSRKEKKKKTFHFLAYKFWNTFEPLKWRTKKSATTIVTTTNHQV